jgi:hypothetical protein
MYNKTICITTQKLIYIILTCFGPLRGHIRSSQKYRLSGIVMNICLKSIHGITVMHAKFLLEKLIGRNGMRPSTDGKFLKMDFTEIGCESVNCVELIANSV